MERALIIIQVFMNEFREITTTPLIFKKKKGKIKNKHFIGIE